jgi:hypothetical protein
VINHLNYQVWKIDSTSRIIALSKTTEQRAEIFTQGTLQHEDVLLAAESDHKRMIWAYIEVISIDMGEGET